MQGKLTLSYIYKRIRRGSKPFITLSYHTFLYHSSNSCQKSRSLSLPLERFLLQLFSINHVLPSNLSKWSVDNHLAQPYVTSLERKKKAVRKWRVAHARLRRSDSAGGGCRHRLKRASRPARASQLTSSVANARPSSRQTQSNAQCPHSRVIKQTPSCS